MPKPLRAYGARRLKNHTRNDVKKNEQCLILFCYLIFNNLSLSRINNLCFAFLSITAMQYLIQTIFQRSPELAVLGLTHFIALAAFGILSLLDNRILLGINVWIKPMKFAVSIAIYAWTVAWFVGYLPESGIKNAIVWTIIVTMAIETICITGQAGRGVLSHFNVATPWDGAIFTTMGIAIAINTFAVMVAAWLFFQELPVALEPAYLWAIRLGLIIFVIASWEGFLMAARLQHSVGAPDGSVGLPFLNWSRSVGDLRVAHFIGLHAIQVLPLTAFFLAGRVSPQNALVIVVIMAIVYAALCILAFLQALAGIPFLKS